MHIHSILPTLQSKRNYCNSILAHNDKRTPRVLTALLPIQSSVPSAVKHANDTVHSAVTHVIDTNYIRLLHTQPIFYHGIGTGPAMDLRALI